MNATCARRCCCWSSSLFISNRAWTHRAKPHQPVQQFWAWDQLDAHHLYSGAGGSVGLLLLRLVSITFFVFTMIWMPLGPKCCSTGNLNDWMTYFTNWWVHAAPKRMPEDVNEGTHAIISWLSMQTEAVACHLPSCTYPSACRLKAAQLDLITMLVLSCNPLHRRTFVLFGLQATLGTVGTLSVRGQNTAAFRIKILMDSTQRQLQLYDAPAHIHRHLMWALHQPNAISMLPPCSHSNTAGFTLHSCVARQSAPSLLNRSRVLCLV